MPKVKVRPSLRKSDSALKPVKGYKREPPKAARMKEVALKIGMAVLAKRKAGKK